MILSATRLDVVQHISLDQTSFGAFDGKRIIGFATVSHRIFGAAARYVQLVCFQISEEYRRQGIARKLFSLACEEARRLGADKLYISAHSSKESQAAYRALGCTPAEEVNEELAAAGPFDVIFQVSSHPETASVPPCGTSARRPP